MKVKSLEEIRAHLLPLARQAGVELADVEFKQGRSPSLTIFIDSEEGVDLDACERMHRLADEALDELDPTFGEPYTLNVSSLGIDRPLKTDRDFEKCLGEKVEVRLFAPVRGKKYLEGALTAYDDNTVTVDDGKEPLRLERTRIAKINRAIEFDFDD